MCIFLQSIYHSRVIRESWPGDTQQTVYVTNRAVGFSYQEWKTQKLCASKTTSLTLESAASEKNEDQKKAYNRSTS